MSRPTEETALRELPATEQKEYEAVKEAIRRTKEKQSGEEILRMIRLVYWDRSHTIYGASMALNVSEITAKRWHVDFVKEVAKIYGFLER